MNNSSSPVNKDYFAVIMAGGKGERFWPLSRAKTPKQLLTLIGGRSFLQQAVDHVRPIVPAENILIITNQAQLAAARKQLPELPKENLIAEPCGRDTCAAVTLGAAIAGSRSAAAVIAVLPADHVIPDEQKFQTVLSDTFELAARQKVIVTIGIQPSEPSTGYGYIHVGEPMSVEKDGVPVQTHFSKAQRFVEKPNAETAIAYVSSGQYRWNAGMFIWSYATLTEALAKYQPEMAASCQKWTQAAAKGKLLSVLKKDYPGIKKISVDYALMEKADNVVVADGVFVWDDLGSWTALARHLPADPNGNCVNCATGDFVSIDSSGNLVYDARKKNRTPFALAGIKDCILVQTDDAVMLVHKSQAQRVKELVTKIAADACHQKLL